MRKEHQQCFLNGSNFRLARSASLVFLGRSALALRDGLRREEDFFLIPFRGPEGPLFHPTPLLRRHSFCARLGDCGGCFWT